MEGARQQRRAQDIAHLLARHAALQRLDLLARDDIALQHIAAVGVSMPPSELAASPTGPTLEQPERASKAETASAVAPDAGGSHGARFEHHVSAV